MAFPIEIKFTQNKGRGVFALKAFAPKEVIEVCPVISITKQEYRLMEQTIFDNYMYDWYAGRSCIPLGYGLLYNHSYHPNAKYVFHKKAGTISFYALRKILPGEEILVNYNGDPANMDPLDMQDVHHGGPLVVKE